MRTFKLILIAFSIAALFATGDVAAKSQGNLEHGPTVYNFGHVGIDYTVYLEYELWNTGTRAVHIISAVPSCDCSYTTVKDSLIQPGDTGYVLLSYNTRNFYASTSQSFTITTDDPLEPQFKVYYQSIVGQWIAGIKPDPLSVMFLPGQKPKVIAIDNTHFAEMSAEYIDQADTTFTVKFLSSEANKGERIEMEISPNHSLESGTYDSSFRIQVRVPAIEDPVILSIPVKVVVY
jgi:hypothetical protein